MEQLWQERESLLKRIEELERASKCPTATFRIAAEQRKQDKQQAGSPKGIKGNYKEIEEIMGINNQTIWTHVYQAVKILRDANCRKCLPIGGYAVYPACSLLGSGVNDRLASE